MNRLLPKLTSYSQILLALGWFHFLLSWCQWRKNTTTIHKYGKQCHQVFTTWMEQCHLPAGTKQQSYNFYSLGNTANEQCSNQSSLVKQKTEDDHLHTFFFLQLKISFNESSLHSTYEYPSESSVWDSGEEDEEEKQDGKVPDEQPSMVGRIHNPRPSLTSSTSNSNGEDNTKQIRDSEGSGNLLFNLQYTFRLFFFYDWHAVVSIQLNLKGLCSCVVDFFSFCNNIISETKFGDKLGWPWLNW